LAQVSLKPTNCSSPRASMTSMAEMSKPESDVSPEMSHAESDVSTQDQEMSKAESDVSPQDQANGAVVFHLPDEDPDDVTDLSEMETSVIQDDDLKKSKGFLRKSLSRRTQRTKSPGCFPPKELPCSPVCRKFDSMESVAQDIQVVAALAAFGYSACDAKGWHSTLQPRLCLSIESHSEEAGHTLYTIKCVLSGGLNAESCEWFAKKRLQDIRSALNEPAKSELGSDVYKQRFQGAHFARRLGPPGTTKRLNSWCQTLEDCLSERLLRPFAVAELLLFLGAPQRTTESAPVL